MLTSTAISNKRRMVGMVKYVFLGLFVVIMVAIGLFSRRKVKNVQDFFLGGRQMGPWLTAFAYGTTYFSAVIFIGYAGKIGWGFGISATLIGIGNAIIGSLLAWLVLVRRTRKMTHDLNASTMPEFFEKRYDSKAMKIVTALIIFIFLVPYSASVYQGLGYLFERTFGVPFVYCMAAMAILTAVYLLLGGYVATALNDFVQGIVMLAGVGFMIFFILSNPAVGGLSNGLKKLSEIPDVGPGLVSVFSASPINLMGLVILTSLGTWGLPQMVHKFYVAVTPNSILSLMSFSWGTVAGAFLAPFLYGLYWKGTTKAGAWSGFIAGFVVSVAGAIIYKMNASMAPNIGAVAMLVSLAVVPVVSLITAKLPEKHIDKVFAGENAGNLEIQA